MSFASFDLHDHLVRRLEERGFRTPTPLQREVLSPALAGRDVLARAAAGSGKTTALLLPVIQGLLARSADGPGAVVLAADPQGVRRLTTEAAALAAGTPLTWATPEGEGANGAAAFPAADCLLATPEDLLALLEADEASLAGVEVLALDDADHLFQRDLQPVLERLVAGLPRRRQTLIFAAGLPPELAAFAEALQADPARIGWPRQPRVSDEAVLPVREDLKGALLLELLTRDGVGRALVFTRTKHRVNRLADWLRQRGLSTERIHGNRSLRQRSDALSGFDAGRYQVLVATEVSGDGLGEGLPFHVVHYDVPSSPDDYRERLSLSAGSALTLVGDLDEPRIRALERALGRELPSRTLEDFDYDAVPAEGMEVPMEEGPGEVKAKKGRGRSRSRGRSKGERRRAEGGRGGGPPAGGGEVDLNADEEARIRQKAERMQEAAVAARLGRPQPWTAGWHEVHAQQQSRRRPKRKSRGR